MKIVLSIIDGHGNTVRSSDGQDEAFLVARHTYREGDRICVSAAETPCHVELCLDAAMPAAQVYLTANPFTFVVPFGARRKAYPPLAFSGDLKRLFCRRLSKPEIASRRKLSFNPYDDHGEPGAFPHAFANVETRGEAVFAARNAIDGEKANTDHGLWPFTSWGINRDPEASLTIDFGRTVLIDEVALYLRADFPHDAWWERVSVAFSDGESLQFPLVKSGAAQVFPFAPRPSRWMRLFDLVKADDPSPFPALTQVEVFGRDL